MKYGKLFRGLQGEFPQFNKLSGNRCSTLPYKELRNVAGTLYRAGMKVVGSDYMRTSKDELAGRVFRALTTRYK
jgi:hypothetical protein